MSQNAARVVQAPSRERSTSREWPVVLGLCLVMAALWILVNPFGDFPLNDDWVYGLAVKALLATGRFSLPAVSSANVLTQAYWGALFCLPFGFSFDALRVSTCVAGVAGVAASYLLLREAGADRRIAALGALTLAVDPIYLDLTASFMTDVPFTALWTGSLLLYVRGSNRGSTALVVAAYGVALLAIFVRQFALVLPIGFGVAHLYRHRWTMRSLATAILPVLVCAAAHFGFQHWLLTSGRTPQLGVGMSEVAAMTPAIVVARFKTYAILMLPYPALLMSPLLIGLMFLRQYRGHGLWRPIVFWPASVVLGAAVFAVIADQRELIPFYGNVLTPFGIGPLTMHDTFSSGSNLPVIAHAAQFWTVVNVVSAWLTAVLGLVTIRAIVDVARALLPRYQQEGLWRDAMMLCVVAVYLIGVLVLSALAGSFDRYMIVVIIPLSVILLRYFEPRRHVPVAGFAPAAVLVVGFALFAVTATHDYLAWNRARWEATAQLMGHGVQPAEIDGGYEFSGWTLYKPEVSSADNPRSWWTVDDTYMIASGPFPGYQEIAAVPFRTWLWPQGSSISVLKRN